MVVDWGLRKGDCAGFLGFVGIYRGLHGVMEFYFGYWSLEGSTRRYMLKFGGFHM